MTIMHIKFDQSRSSALPTKHLNKMVNQKCMKSLNRNI